MFFIIGVLAITSLFGHHHDIAQAVVPESTTPLIAKAENKSIEFVRWIGNLHLIFLHFPIALIIMTVISELLHLITKNVLFDHASRFMIISAAIFSVPTIIFGFALAYQVPYEGLLSTFYIWHQSLGIFTAILCIWTALLRISQMKSSLRVYSVCLALLLISVTVTGFFGGGLAFGIKELFPPS